MALQPIQSALTPILQQLGITTETQAVFMVWEKEAGNLVTGCCDVALKDKTLYIEVISPVYAQELMIRRHELVKKINGHFPRPVIKDIRYKTAVR